MRRLLSIILSVSMMLTVNVGIVCAADNEDIPMMPDPRSADTIALDLYGSDEEKMPEDRPAELKPIEAGPVEALVQNYNAIGGSFKLTEESRFYIDSTTPPSNSLYSTVRLIDAQFASKNLPSDKPLSVVYGARRFAHPGDVVITSGIDPKYMTGYADPAEAYELNINDRAVITASGTDGVYYGLITLMQMALTNDNNEAEIDIPCCEISDGPDLKERTLFLDCARKYFSKEWIENLIRRASMQRYNAIELHFSEAEGTRIESTVFPWLTAGNKCLTREEVREIVNVAHTYHMDVIPSLDIPGHTQFIIQQYAKYVKKNPDWSFQYGDKTYDKNTKGFKTIANYYSYNGEKKEADYIGIDLTKEHAVAFIDAMVDDYAQFFKSMGCDRINISGDELLGWYDFTLGGQRFGYANRWKSLQHWEKYAQEQLGIKNGSASDTFINYLNTVGSRLEEQGYRVRVFNDEVNLNKDQHLKLNKSIELNYWTGLPGSPKSYAKEGHYMYNDVSAWLFYVVKHKGGGDIMTTDFKSVNTKNIYNNWNPRSLSSKKDKVKMIDEKQFGGSYFHIWCDHPDMKDTQTIWNETNNLTWTNSSKMWNPEITDSLKYKKFMKFVAAMGQIPGYTGNSNEEPALIEPAKLQAGTTFLEKLLTFLGMY